MTIKYFDIKSIQELLLNEDKNLQSAALKKQYHILCKNFHPDKGGDAEAMKQINSEYDYILQNLNKIGLGNINADIEEKYKEVINQLINLDNIIIQIIGCWVWVKGDTRPHAKLLKELKFQYSKNQKCWYLPGTQQHKFRGMKTLSEEEKINKYGATVFQSQGKKSIK